jgi:vacuolar-type H+-ATPase subunit E/Vma4
MALDTLLETLSRDAEADAGRVVAEARAEADRIRADARTALTERCDQSVAVLERGLRADVDARRAASRREAGIDVLRGQSRFLDRIFTASRAAFPGALADPARFATLESMVREALTFFPDTPVTIRCRAGLVAAVTKAAMAMGSVAVVADDTVPEGIVVESSDGSARIDNTLESRLRHMGPQLSIELLAELKGRP